MLQEILQKARAARGQLAQMTDGARSALLLAAAHELTAATEELLAANAEDLARMDPSNPLYDRLLLTPERLEGIAADMRKVAALPSPLDRVLSERTRPNGLRIRQVSVPFGVVGVIYEARPNVTFDVFSLCFKSGNATVLKGGRDADASNRAAVALLRRVLNAAGLPAEAVTLLPATHEAALEMIEAEGYIDLIIPRGGRKLIDFVRRNARIPCIETGAGVVNTYFDAAGDLAKGTRIVTNAKTRRVSVCNALDCLIVHAARLSDLPALVSQMERVTIYADEPAYAALEGRFPRLERAKPEDFGTEFLDYKLSIKTVGSLEEALDHIALYGSGHSEAVVTEDPAVAARFRAEVDAACVYVNAPTSFTDGAQFGLGAEIGISTQKLGARGPMGLDALTSYKWLIDGDGQVRP